MPAISTDGLTKEFGDVTAVSDLELVVEEGEVFGFLGPNGAGKSTTINLLLDFATPTSGSATVLGEDAGTETRELHRRIGVLPEGFDLYDRLTGAKHLRFAAETKDVDADPAALLERVGLDPEDGDRATGEYSKGMKQRLALAIALTGDPELLILDEPSAGLDPTGIERMQEIVRTEAERGTTVFFSSHILGQVEAVCDRVGILSAGELVGLDTIDGLRDRVGGGSTLGLDLDPVPEAALGSLAAIDGVAGYDRTDGHVDVAVTEPAAKARAIDHLEDAGATVLDIRVEETGLDTLFAELTGSDSPPDDPADGGEGGAP